MKDDMARFSHVYGLPAATLMFLFSGMYKTLVPFPVDVTVFMAGLLCLLMAPRWREFRDLAQPLVVLVIALNVYLAIRLYPDFAGWGIRKLGEAVLFGTPTLMAGFLIAREADTRKAILRLLVWIAVPFAVIVVFQTIDRPNIPSAIGGSGYQLTGIFFALAIVASATLRNPYTFGISALGGIVSGHVGGSAFGTAAAGIVILASKDWRFLITASLCSILFVTAYTAMSGPPLVLKRVAWKVTGTRYFLDKPSDAAQNTVPALPSAASKSPVATTPAAKPTEPVLTPAAKPIEPILKPAAKPTEPVKTFAPIPVRLIIWFDAIEKIKTSPILGVGYGNASYDMGPKITSRTPHNVFFEMFAEAGIIAMALFTAMMTLAGHQAFKSRDYFALGALVFVFLMAMVSGYWGGRVTMFALGLVAAYPWRGPGQQVTSYSGS